MKSVLISIQPRWCELIASGKKTIEARKTRPKLETPFKCYIYCTKDEPLYHSGEKFVCGDGFGNGFVVGEFVCDKLVWVISHPNIFAGHPLLHLQAIQDACITTDDAELYSNGKDVYGWHISDLVIYDKPKALSRFMKPCSNDLYCEACAMYSEFEEKCYNAALQIKRPPQSWCYVEKVRDDMGCFVPYTDVGREVFFTKSGAEERVKLLEGGDGQ